ncbi:hypothetical protein [Pontibacter rugosus]|uniref:Uncharacterized protein n=1 Tax=Pontibacter rugosus TaxID=1745966 RepID=A0ABW3SQU0_9BACT
MITKAVLRYFLSLCILLLSVHGQAFAQAYQHDTGSAFLTNFKATQHFSFRYLDLAPDFTVKAAAVEKNLNAEAADIEEEDKEYLVSGKLLEYSKYLTAALYALTLAYFFRFFKTSLLFCKHISDNSSKRRYLIFQVFRI